MAWSLVGETGFNIPDTGTDTDVTLPGSPAEGDVVVFAMASDGSIDSGIQTAGYSILMGDTAQANPGHQCGIKRLGSTVDTVATFNLVTSEYAAGVLQVWRGADTTFQDTAATTVLSSGTPNGASIVVATADSLVINVMMLDDDNVAGSVVAVSGCSNLIAHDNSDNLPDNATAAMCSIQRAAGAYDPGDWTGMSDAFACVTIALRIDQGSSTIVPLVMHHRRMQRIS